MFVRTAAHSAAVRKLRGAMLLLSAGRTFFLGADGYDTARREAVSNGLLPNRFAPASTASGEVKTA